MWRAREAPMMKRRPRWRTRVVPQGRAFAEFISALKPREIKALFYKLLGETNPAADRLQNRWLGRGCWPDKRLIGFEFSGYPLSTTMGQAVH
jgi:hypothetical protein